MSYGKHEYLQIEKVLEQFERCRRDVSMRSVSAVVRISREQLSARGSLGSYRWVAAGFLTAGIVALLLNGQVPEAQRESARNFGLGAIGVTLLLAVGIGITWKDTQRYTAEEKTIRVATFEALESLLSQPGLKQKPPDWTEANFLRKLGAQRAGSALRAWLETAKD